MSHQCSIQHHDLVVVSHSVPTNLRLQWLVGPVVKVVDENFEQLNVWDTRSGDAAVAVLPRGVFFFSWAGGLG